MKILVLNAGSSSQKACLFEVPENALPTAMPAPLWEAQFDGDDGALRQQIQMLWKGESPVLAREIAVVGHRIVHGGRDFEQPTRITPEVKAAITRLSSLAPAHNPAAVRGIELIEELLGDVPQIAVFDTAFHATIPPEAAIYPIPFAWSDEGLRRFGFHGISHQDCALRAARLLGRDVKELRLITCHLGNGCSLCAVKNGHSVDTTMGFTPLEGLMMGTRSGSVDPGLLLYLLREKGMGVEELAHLLNHESGLRGVSGVSGDLREVMAASEAGDARAGLALDVYVHRLRFHVGAMLGALGGVDALVFTGGVGEHSAFVRAAVCQAFTFLGLSVSHEKNRDIKGDGEITDDDSIVRALVIKAQEDWTIARSCWILVAAPPAVPSSE